MISTPSFRPAVRKGALAPLVALVLTGLIGVVAIAIDGGALLSEKRHAQATADAAAMAAACVLYQNYPVYNGTGPVTAATNAALDVAKANGYDPSTGNASVVVNIPPASGSYAGLAGYAEVIVTYHQPVSFSSIWNSAPLPVKARAVARGAWVTPNIGVIVLNYSGQGTLNTQGTGYFTDVGAPVIVNSNNPSAAIAGGGGSFTAPEYDITGNFSTSGNGTFLGPNGSAPTIYTGVHPTPDPLAYLPPVGDPTNPNSPPVPPPGSISVAKNPNGPGNIYTLTPGSYGGPGDPTLPNFTNGDQIILGQASTKGNGTDGIYYLAAGGFTTNGASITMDTTDPNHAGGVMFYNAGTGTNDGINIAGNSNGTVNIGPLQEGIYSGLTFFQARNAPESVQISGNGTFNIAGTIYSPDALLTVTGNGKVSNIGSQYVSLDLNVAGNGNVNITYGGSPAAKTRIITLVE